MTNAETNRNKPKQPQFCFALSSISTPPKQPKQLPIGRGVFCFAPSPPHTPPLRPSRPRLGVARCADAALDFAGRSRRAKETQTLAKLILRRKSIAARRPTRCINQPMSNALQTKDRPDKPERIRKRLKYGLDAMIWGGPDGQLCDYVAAAKLANISTRIMRKNLERPQVLSYLRAQREVFRASLSTKSLQHLDQLSAQRKNLNAAVAACRAVLGQDDAQPRSFNAESPHLTIRIVNQPAAPAPVTIEHKPLEPELGSDPNDPCRELAPARFRDPTRGDL
jgi:hypothetical protein